jgi:hypothetical protein
MPAPKDYIKISYPRKCSHCDYVSNNPQMYSYHKHTHDPIPAGQICDYGCGQLALFRNTGGKYTCEKLGHHCPEYLRKHSERVAEHWQRPEAQSRKEKTKETFFKYCAGVPEVIAKGSNTKREKFGTLDPARAKEYRHYARFIRQRAQRWAKSQGYVLGQQTYHVDHKLSILDAWKVGLTEEVVNHPANLQILEAKLNSGKGAKSILTVDELLAEIKRLS